MTKNLLSEQLNFLDIFVFVLVLIVTISAVIYGNNKRNKTNNENENFLDFLIMGRKLSLPLFIATLVATWYGGLFGVTQIAFESGIYNFLTQGVFWYATYIFFALFMIKKIRSYNAVTLPELIGQLFGPKASFVGATFNILNIIPISYTISLGLLLKSLWGIELFPAMLLSVSFVTLYSFFGGFRAVVYSDLIQFFVMCIGVALVLFFSIYEFGGISFLQANLPEKHFSPLGGHSLATTLVWGLIATSTLVDPNFYQRCFAAKSNKVAINGILISTVIWVIFDLCTTLGAMYAKATMPELASASAYLHYALNILPHGLKGFVLAGIVATILSTIDSYLFLAGTTLTYDILGKFFPNKRSSVWLSHLGIILIASFSIGLAMMFDGNIKAVWKTLGSYSSACLLFPVLWGYVFPKTITDIQFVLVCITGVISTTYWRLGSHNGFSITWLADLDELYIGIFCTATTLLTMALTNATKPKRKSI